MVIETEEWASLIIFRRDGPTFVNISSTDKKQDCIIDNKDIPPLIWNRRDTLQDRKLFTADAVAFHEFLRECVFYPKEIISVLLKYSVQHTFRFDLKLSLSSFGASMENVGYGLKISNTSYTVNASEKVEIKTTNYPGVIAVLRKDIISTFYRSQIDAPQIGSVVHLAACTLNPDKKKVRIQLLQLQFGGFGANDQFDLFEEFPGWLQELLICRGAHIGVSDDEYTRIFAELNRISTQ